jgi:hypothetical protein
VVADLGERNMLGDICLHGLVKVIGANSLNGRIESVYFDEGIYPPKIAGLATVRATPALSGVDIRFGNDSRKVIGIQLADLAANYVSAQLQYGLGMPQKKINVGAEGGYDPPIDVEIGWALGIAIRWSFFCKPCEDANSEDPQPEVNVMAAGGYISSGLREPVAAVVRQTYEHHWLGCIH